MKLIPTKNQFLNWSIPSKVGYIAFVATFIAIVLTIAIFIIQLCVGASKELQNEASKDRNIKHEELVDYFDSIDNKLQLQTSSYEDMRETINKISSKIEDTRLVQKSIINREILEASKYYPSGYKLEGFIIGPTEISKKLKAVFTFMNENFTKEITGKQFKEINKLLEGIIQTNQLLPYTWFYRGMLFSFIRADEELGNDFYRIGQICFSEADKRFDLLIDRYPQNPFLLLYKGMTLTHLSRGEESVTYLRKALQIDPKLFTKTRLLGIRSIWKHIDQKYVDEWEAAFEK